MPKPPPSNPLRNPSPRRKSPTAPVQSGPHFGSKPPHTRAISGPSAISPVQSGPHLEEIRLGAPIDLFPPSEIRDSRAFDRLSRISSPPTRAIGGPSRISSRWGPDCTGRKRQNLRQTPNCASRGHRTCARSNSGDHPVRHDRESRELRTFTGSKTCNKKGGSAQAASPYKRVSLSARP